MAAQHLPMTGGCRCGAVRIEVSAAPIITAACHCMGCQKMSASAYSLSAAIPADGFRVTQGEPVIGGMRGPSRHFFCPNCLSWMFTRPEGMDWFVNLRPTMLDNARWFVPFIETYLSERLPWATTPAVHGYAEHPPFEDFERLAAEFAAQTA